eukprot:3917912-Prymnesium_polylepis.1
MGDGGVAAAPTVKYTIAPPSSLTACSSSVLRELSTPQPESTRGGSSTGQSSRISRHSEPAPRGAKQSVLLQRGLS